MVRLSLSTCIAALASSALASQLDVLMKRETIEKGSPLYNCHEACGEIIEMSAEDGYCTSSNFSSDLSTCLKCAYTCDIWQYYGSDVKSAATNCSDSATPSSSSSASSCASTTGSTSTATNTAATAATNTATSTTSSTASAAATSSAAASVLHQNIAFSGAIGFLAWALAA
ncbi:hypothetical protein N7456_009185 [Penicillium angulare]|uniref:Uncharacterized protein n=1 Tax=Penicillium angulare TaxID=116970 RepID=A0A9W9F486_9EURO|nr:hypothetical protein N7456_009185 [Penicillium angulare]